MDHVAIMRKSWGLTKKIAAGHKLIESRWYCSRRAPWNRIKPGELVYFKDSGEPVTVKAEVSKVMQFPDLTPDKVKALLDKYAHDDGIGTDNVGKFFEMFKNKRYCILVSLKNPREIEPFNINKAGFGAMSAWISVSDISSVKE